MWAAKAVSAALRGSSSFSCVCWSFTFSGFGLVWSQVCGPSCDSSDARLHRPDALAFVRTLSFCRRRSLPWAFIRPGVRRPRPCLGSSLLLGGAHLPWSWVFAWRLWPLDGPGTCSFLGLTLDSSLSLPVLAASLGWLRFILGCPPSVASLRRLLPWFFAGYLLDCPHGAAVPLASWVLWCS